MKTLETQKEQWILINAENKVLGRLASQIASLLAGKHKSQYARHLDTGDHVVVINASKIRLTGKKRREKTYKRFSGYPGGLKERSFDQVSSKDPGYPLWHAVKGMLPKNSLGNHQLKKLKIYPDVSHPHQAQHPKEWV